MAEVGFRFPMAPEHNELSSGKNHTLSLHGECLLLVNGYLFAEIWPDIKGCNKVFLRDWPYGNDAASATIIDGIQVNFFTAATHVGVHMSLEFMV